MDPKTKVVKKNLTIRFLVFCVSIVMMFLLVGEGRWNYAESERKTLEKISKNQRNSMRQYNIQFRNRVRCMENYLISKGYDPNSGLDIIQDEEDDN